MFNHQPKEYKCPFCNIVQGGPDEYIADSRKVIFYQDKDMTAFVSSHWWPNNRGSVIIIPNEHIENSDELLAKIHVFSKKAAIGLKEVYKCDGVSVRQHNEPAGNQKIWHYHLHVFPRYKQDRLYQQHDRKYLADPKERIDSAASLKAYFQDFKSF